MKEISKHNLCCQFFESKFVPSCNLVITACLNSQFSKRCMKNEIFH